MVNKFKLNRSAVSAFLKGSEVSALVRAYSRASATKAGPGFESQVRVGERARGYVYPATYAARRKALKDHALERAIGGPL